MWWDKRGTGRRMSMKKISVIVPCYNVEKEVDRCVESIVSQTIGLDALEIILVDDASTDSTYQKLCAWEQKYPDSILVIHCEENMHQGGARNIGLRYAGGEYIGYVDSDDWIDPDMYRILYDAITTHNCDLSAVLFQRDYEHGKIYDCRSDKMIFGKKVTIHTVEERKKFLKSGLPGGVYTKLYRADFLRQNNIFFPEHLFYEDGFFGALVAYSLSSYIIIDTIRYHYMLNLSSVTTENGVGHLDRLKIDVMMVQELQKRGYMKDYYYEIEDSFLQSYWCMMLKRLFLQFSVFPYDILEVMRKTVKLLFPNYLQNPYLESYDETQKMFLRLLEIEVSHEQIDEIAQKYRQAFRNDAVGMYQREGEQS
jgi:glycosyltransferase involved in cell wall biosynthesis